MSFAEDRRLVELAGSLKSLEPLQSDLAVSLSLSLPKAKKCESHYCSRFSRSRRTESPFWPSYRANIRVPLKRAASNSSPKTAEPG